MSFDREKLKKYPLKPGVYIMKDSSSKVIYVGKATNLRNRIKQYFQKTDTRPTIGLLTTAVKDIEVIIVNNDKEALLLENTLIKKYKPKYNILLKDDKTYVSIVITTQNKWPELKLVRLKKQPKDKNLYFGPYTNARAARSIKDLLLKLFPLRQCSLSELNNRTRPCILYDIKKCIAPCMNKCTKKEYDGYVLKAINFLKGKDSTIIKNLKKQMKIASDNLEYEKADECLKLISQIHHLMQHQYVDILSTKNTDVIGFYNEGSSYVIVKLIFIDGRLTFSEHFSFSDLISKKEDIIESFILQNYIAAKAMPFEIIVPIELTHLKNIEEVLTEKSGKKIKLIFPKKGKKNDLIKLANKNAKSLFLREKDLKSLREKQLLELQEILKLNNFPKQIICLDTSNISSTNPVAAIITFTDGEKDKSKTKLFKIKTDIKGDVPYMKEVLFRHFSKLKEEDFPDLLVLDGGKAQLNAAMSVLKKLNIASIDIISLTKEKALHTKGLTKEKVFVPHNKNPIFLDPKSPMLFLLQKIRDEAHRVAITFHKKRRKTTTIKTSLIDIPGIGEKKTKILLKKFKSIKNLKKTKKKDLEKIKILTSSDIKKILKLD